MGKRGTKRPRPAGGKSSIPKRSMAVATPMAVAQLLNSSQVPPAVTKPKLVKKGMKKGKNEKKKSISLNPNEAVVIKPVRNAPAVVSSSQLDMINQANPNPKRVGGYTNSQWILLVGEGDFSFGAALATSLGGNRIVATSYDSGSLVLGKYRTTATVSLNKLKRTGATVLHNIDAVHLSTTIQREWKKCALGAHMVSPPLFDRIVFNFPHAGGATQEDVERNRQILLGYFSSGEGLLSQNGRIHVTLRNTVFYQSWDLKGLVEEHLSDKLKYIGTKPFDMAAYKLLGYGEVRTNPATREAPATENAVTYEWKSLNSSKHKTQIAAQSIPLSQPSTVQVSSPEPKKKNKNISLVDQVERKKALRATKKMLRQIEQLKTFDVRTLNKGQREKITREKELQSKLKLLLQD